jgi:hypothetical protein|tara:strand:- start:124 stop:555 length:432 start_codon:yes stop_codon:yes gene_type:complete
MSISLFNGKSTVISTSSDDVPTAKQRVAYFVGVAFGELHKVLAISDAQVMKTVKQGYGRIFPRSELNTRLGMLNNVMKQVGGTIDELEMADTLEETVAEGRELQDRFMGSAAPTSVRINKADLQAFMKGNTDKYIEIPINKQE